MEALIELVSAFPILYDPKHQDYLRLSLKERIWEHISRKLNLPSGEVAKTNWRKLRDAHRVALRRQRKKKSDNGDSVIRPWVFQKNMEFLLPFMPNYSGLSDFDSEDHGFQETGNVSHIFDDYASIENELNSTLPQKKSQEHNDSFDYTCLEDELPPDKLPSPRKKSKTASKSAKIGLVSDESLILKTLKNLEERAAARDSLRQTIKSNMSTPHRHSNNDPLYSFFVSMYNTTKNFPVRHQLEVRREVFNLITKIEESVLMGGDVASNSSGKNRQQTVSSEYDSSGIVSSLTTML